MAAGLPLVGMDAVRARFLERNLDPSVVDVILQARKQVTWVTYLRYWDKFVAFCAERSIDPWTADIGQILSHVESQRSTLGWHFSTVKVCVSAIATFRGSLGVGITAFTHELMTQYLAGARRISEDARVFPDTTWDVSIVFKALQGDPFEPMEVADIKYVSAKLAILLALCSAARGCELTALTVKGLTFSGDLKVTVFPDPGFRPKTVGAVTRRGPLVLHAFHPSPRTAAQRRLHLLCPVRALRIYLQRVSETRLSDRLLLTYGGRTPGSALSTQRLAHWLVDGITMCYTLQGKTAPKLRAHSTRGVSTSIAVQMGTDWDTVRETASWSSDVSFLRHYFVHQRVRGVAEAVLAQAECS